MAQQLTGDYDGCSNWFFCLTGFLWFINMCFGSGTRDFVGKNFIITGTNYVSLLIMIVIVFSAINSYHKEVDAEIVYDMLTPINVDQVNATETFNED